MKKLIISILCVMLLTGCGTKDIETNVKTDVSDSVTEQIPVSAEEKIQAQETIAETEEDNTNYGNLSFEYLVDIGCTPEQISAIRGELKTAIWADGPLYSFGNDDIWYGFESYDFGEEGIPYIPSGKCTQLSLGMKMLIKDADVYSIDTLKALSNAELTGEYDELAECNVYTAYCDGYELKVYADNEKNIGAETMVTVKEQ